MMEFTGLCLGGPLDGNLLRWPSDRYSTVERGPIPTFDLATDANVIITTAPLNRFDYEHFSDIFSYGHRLRGFWVPASVLERDRFKFILNTLTESYQERARKP